MSTPLFSTPHSPVGAWSSLTFGAAGKGASITEQCLCQKTNADLLIALSRDGTTSALPFIDNPADYANWRILPGESLTRTLTPCVDEFAANDAGISIKLFTPHAALPNPKRSGNLQYATVPGILIEATFDNSNSDSPATAFIGVNYRGHGSLRPLDWSSKTLVGVGHTGRWVLATSPVKDEIYTYHANTLADAPNAPATVINPGACAGGIVIKIAPRTKRTVNLVFAFYNADTATQGSTVGAGRHVYTMYFPRVEAVANYLLTNGQKIRESCSSFDGRASAACPDPAKLSLFARAIRAYEANTQLIDAEGAPFFTALSTGEKSDRGFRNPLDQIIDHLPWELYRNPWVIRNVFDLATASYAYHDKVRFPSDAGSESELPPPRDGGMTFAHDMGFLSCYTPGGQSAYEHPNKTGPGSFMSTDVLLNGVYLLTSYALLADDTPWAKTRLPFARELMTNMENRDHWDPEKRTGILKAESEKVDTNGAETTAFAGVGRALEQARGSLYIAVKTFCANLLLTTYYQNNNDLHSADYSYAFAQKTAQALVVALNQETGVLPANLLDASINERVIAALEPLAVPTYLGLTSTLAEYFPDLFNALKRHTEACLKPVSEGGCVDANGALRLSSGSEKSLPAKTISILYVLERLFGIDIQAQYPQMWQRVVDSADPTDARLITAALYIKQ